MKTYTVSGPFPFGPHAPGSTFRAETNPVIERALARGSITEDATPEAVPSAPPAPTPKSTAKPSGHIGPKSTKEDTK